MKKKPTKSKTPDKKVVKKIKNNEVTSKKLASIASKLLKDPKSSKEVKQLAGSVLTQTPNKPKPAPTKKKKG